MHLLTCYSIHITTSVAKSNVSTVFAKLNRKCEYVNRRRFTLVHSGTPLGPGDDPQTKLNL